MKNFYETVFCWCIVAILTGTSLAQVDQSSDESSRDDADSKRGWNMMRWGRGLQMLRLGKRSANQDSLGFWRQGRSFGSHDNTRLTSSDIQALLDSIFDEARDDTRRQPPLPRYGRDSSRFLVDNNSDDIGAHLFEFFPVSNPRSFFRPAPRGGRYRRSHPEDKLTFNERFSPRTMTFSRTEQAMNQAENLQPQMEPSSSV